MKHIDPKNTPFQEIHKYLLGGVAPRPIALVSTISEKDELNLSPFSFFNAFGANPPIVAFSPARRGRDGTLKDTYNNIMATKECVIQAVTYPMVEQVSLSSTEYDSGINEFDKSGLTPVDSYVVKPKRVKESPFQMECILKEMIPLGENNGSGNLAICEVVYFHIAEDIIENGSIHPNLIDLVGRNSGNYYTRAFGESIFEIEKPVNKKGIGYDSLPDFIKSSHIYSANNLGKFGNTESIPTNEEVLNFINSFEISENSTEEAFFRSEINNNYVEMLKHAIYFSKGKHNKAKTFIELTAKCALENNNSDFAWKTALYANLI